MIGSVQHSTPQVVLAKSSSTVAASTACGATNQPNTIVYAAPDPAVPGGYWDVEANGCVTANGGAPFYGQFTGSHLNQPMVGIAAANRGSGYYLVGADGGVFPFGNAPFYGSVPGLLAAHGIARMNKPAVGIAPAPSGTGYDVIASDGGIFVFGSAPFEGSVPGNPADAAALPGEGGVVAMAFTPDGKGYYEVTATGAIYTFGDARFYNATGNDPQHLAHSPFPLTLNKPVVGIAVTTGDSGYWLVASDGGVFSFGNAPFEGSGPAIPTHSATVGIVEAATQPGYNLIQVDGNVRTFPVSPTTPVPAPTPSQAGSPSPNPVPMPAPIGSPSHPLVGNPPSNYPTSPAVQDYCGTYPLDMAKCNAATLALIDDALAGEGYGPLVLPSDFSSLPTLNQLFVVTNAERVVRGTPAYAGPVSSLDTYAQTGAAHGTDPLYPYPANWGSIWAGGYTGALEADFAWMYADGAGGANIDCKYAGDAGCWGHRDNIIRNAPGSAGIGVAVFNGGPSFAELFVDSPT